MRRLFACARTTVALVGFVVVGACHCGDPLVVRRVLVDVDPAAVANDVDREEVRATMSEVLSGTRGITIDDNRPEGATLRLRVESFARTGPADGTGGEVPPATLSLSIDVTEGGRPTLRAHSVASVHGVLEPRVLLEQALADALRQVLQSHAADKLGSDELLGWLSDTSTSASQQKRAMQALGSRREKRATPALMALLKSEDNELAATALQALTLLGDESAVDAIIAYSDRQPAQLRNLCIDAVAAAGSRRALPWLFTLSSGHPDAAVQAHARAALSALEVSEPARL